MNTTIRKNASAAFLIVLGFLAFVLPSSAQAGSYIVAQCSPGLFQDAPDAGFTANTDHFLPVKDCGASQQGLQIQHVLPGGATGTEQGRFGAWVLQAPSGTCLSGGSVYSRLATQNGIHGFLVVSPDAGAGVVTENQNDDQLHLSAIPAGCWRFFVSRLECTQPNNNGRCVGATPGAHAWVKQLRLQLTDLVPPSLSVGGTMLSGRELRSSQTLTVNAADQGAGLRAIGVTVNGVPAAGDDFSASCWPLPENMTARMSPCPPSASQTYTLNTETAPFRDGANTVGVCVADYATEGTPNTVCQSYDVTVDALCPASPRGGGVRVTAGFGNGKVSRTLPYGKKSLLRGRVLDAAGNGVPGASVCIEGHMRRGNVGFRLLGVAVANDNGGWSHKLNKGANRDLLVAYRSGGEQVETPLALNVRAYASLHISKLVTRDQKPVIFVGGLPGPVCDGRQVILRGKVPGARRSFLVRHGRTDPLCHFRMRYRFEPVEVPTKFVFTVLVPQQRGYPFVRGRSKIQFIRVRPCGAPCDKKHHGGRKHGKQKHHGKRHHKHGGRQHGKHKQHKRIGMVGNSTRRMQNASH